MDQKKTHLVPQVVLDVYDGVLRNSSNQFTRDNHILRLEAILEFCQEALTKINSSIDSKNEKSSGELRNHWKHVARDHKIYNK